jgi:transcriptional regulator with XRE-family HTH domain
MSSISAQTLGQRIRYYRKKIGLSIKKLAAVIGVSPTVLGRYETDAREPNTLILMKLAGGLNVTADALLGLEPHPDLIAQNRDEADWLRIFRKLNELGRDRALEYVSEMSEMLKYAEQK